jgi:hypothetical protein
MMMLMPRLLPAPAATGQLPPPLLFCTERRHGVASVRAGWLNRESLVTCHTAFVTMMCEMPRARPSSLAQRCCPRQFQAGRHLVSLHHRPRPSRKPTRSPRCRSPSPPPLPLPLREVIEPLLPFPSACLRHHHASRRLMSTFLSQPGLARACSGSSSNPQRQQQLDQHARDTTLHTPYTPPHTHTTPLPRTTTTNITTTTTSSFHAPCT